MVVEDFNDLDDMMLCCCVAFAFDDMMMIRGLRFTATFFLFPSPLFPFSNDLHHDRIITKKCIHSQVTSLFFPPFMIMPRESTHTAVVCMSVCLRERFT